MCLNLLITWQIRLVWQIPGLMVYSEGEQVGACYIMSLGKLLIPFNNPGPPDPQSLCRTIQLQSG